ncbi:MAG: twin-arginine translocase TatA/TatE family subunit [Bacteroidales bacterium]
MVHPNILLFGISGGEILVLLLLVLLLFGPGKIPEMARMVGRGMREVKKVQREINTEIHRYSSDIEKEAREMRSELTGKPGGNRGSNQEGAASETGDDHIHKKPRSEYQAEEKSREEGQTGQSGDNKNEIAQPDTPADNEDDDLPYPYGRKKNDDGLNRS